MRIDNRSRSTPKIVAIIGLVGLLGAALIASLRPDEAPRLWTRIETRGFFTPLNNVESLMFTNELLCEQVVWNALKGSWKLSLQTLGWGRLLTGENSPLYEAMWANDMLRRGYSTLSPSLYLPLILNASSSPTPIKPTPTNTSTLTPTATLTPKPTDTPTPTNTPTPTIWEYEREMEFPDEYTVGQMIYRSNASGQQVHGQFGTTSGSPWLPKPGYVEYVGINMPQIDHLYLRVRYSKHSSSSVRIRVYIDNESTPRASFKPKDQMNWNQFTWTDAIDLGSVNSGIHSIKLDTDGQKFGVADLDIFALTE